MQAVILAGGLGTRLEEETITRPKPMVEIGDKPILWHIMKMYSSHGVNDFVICLGYKGYMIKEYFLNYLMHNSDVTIDISNNSVEVLNKEVEPWKITLVDTGSNTMTGGRLKRVARFIKDQTFLMTYGDGVSDVNITELIEFHKRHQMLATVTAVKPSGRFGVLDIKNDKVERFEEKPQGDGGYINGGFFVLNKQVVEYIKDDASIWEREPLESIVSAGQLMAYNHDGFWHPMDTLRDKKFLNSLWQDQKAPWKQWS